MASSFSSSEICGISNVEGEDHEQKLQALRSLIPYITKTDKRSVLEATLDYLQKIHQETEEIEKELMSQRSAKPILGVETKEIAEGKFVVNIRWKKGKGVACYVQRIVECSDLLSVSSVQVHERNSDEMITTAFLKVEKNLVFDLLVLKVKNGIHITNEELHNLIMAAEVRLEGCNL